MNWTLLHGDVPVARLTQVDYDQPWFVCDFRREPEFAAIAPLIADYQRELDEDEEGGDAESEWLELHASLHAGSGDPPQPPIRPYMLRVDGDVAHLRI